MPKRHAGGSNLSQDLWAEGPETEVLGTLAIPSGKVVVCDAGVLDSRVLVDVPPGDYVVRIQTDGRGTNVAATLIRAGATPVAFDEEVGAYAVDAGMSGFFDAKVHAAASTFHFPLSIYDDLISEHLDPAEDAGHAGAFVPFEGATFSACRSGDGDGVYPVFVGKDASGSVVAVVTTF